MSVPVAMGGNSLPLLADRQGCAPRPGGPGERVRAEYTVDAVDAVAGYAPSAAPS
jgi:hypothetical protein